MTPLQFYRWLFVLNGAVPLLMLVWDAYRGQLGANSVNYALHVTGILSLVFLFLSLLITPLRWLTGWGGWVAFRRTLGLYGFFYSIVHLVIYIGFDRGLSLSSTWQEIVKRRFLQVGVAAVLLMVPLAVTSTNSMIQRIGSRRWKLLHRAAYLVAALGVIHYYMLVKSDVRQPLAFAGVLTVLLGSRLGRHYFERVPASRTKQQAANTKPLTNAIGQQVATVSAKPRQRWTGELRVAAIFEETHDVKTFRLMGPDESPFPFDYLPGQFLNLQLLIGGKTVNRSYTIASSPTRRDFCELTIKRDPNGLASRYLHDQLKAGDTLKVSGPSGRFVFTGKESNSVFLIAGGVGITPMMSIVRYLTDRAWSGEIYFLLVAQTERDLIFYDEIELLKHRFPQLHVCTTLTRCGPTSMWSGDRGRATASLINRFVPELRQHPVYLCGPNDMMDATRELLVGMGVPSEQIQTEAFAARRKDPVAYEVTSEAGISAMGVESPAAPSPSEAANFNNLVTFARTMVHAEVTSGMTVLEAAEAASIELPYECRAGICGQCKTRLIDGIVDMECEDALTMSDKSLGWILACQARPRSNITVDA